VILPLSNPTALAEARPADLLHWTDGQALVATGSPFAAVPLADGPRSIGQCNNCFLFPGLGFAAVALGLRCITDAMIDAGLQALADQIPASRDPGQPLMPPLQEAGAVARAVAEAVALVGVRDGQARLATSGDEARRRLEQVRWRADYRPLLATAAPPAA
jgi:malate dehydrogenase (oxaloacetate-decarboxylating)